MMHAKHTMTHADLSRRAHMQRWGDDDVTLMVKQCSFCELATPVCKVSRSWKADSAWPGLQTRLILAWRQLYLAKRMLSLSWTPSQGR